MRGPTLFLTLLVVFANGQSQRPARTSNDPPPRSALTGQIQIPNRPSDSLFIGQEGKQRTEIHFDPATGLVTLKLLVQDLNGYFIPDLRRDNFVVYENDVRQTNATVEIEHAPVSLALALEFGGRYPSLNKILANQVFEGGRQLIEAVGREDRIAIWKYADRPELITDFSQDHETLNTLLSSPQPPSVSEANLYDALIAILGRMREVDGRKAVVLLSSGVDTFSKAPFDEALKVAAISNTPVYAISFGEMLQRAADVFGTAAQSARIDWKRAKHELGEIARASGGRLYSPSISIDLSVIDDDIMENLKVRYVITYKSPAAGNLDSPRKVRVELVNPKTGGPIQIVDASGKTIHAHVVLEDSYVPSKAIGEQP
jgi:Ca-activated chloride channel family protein